MTPCWREVEGGRCVARSLGIVQGVFGPQGFLVLWDAWTCLPDFSSAVQGSALGSSSASRFPGGSGPGMSQRRVSPLFREDRYRPLRCKCLKCVMFSVAGGPAGVMSGCVVNCSQSAEGHQMLVLCTEETVEFRYPDACCSVLEDSCLQQNGSVEPSWLKQPSALCILLTSEGGAWACSTTLPLQLDCQHPEASDYPLGDRRRVRHTCVCSLSKVHFSLC